MSEQRRRGPMGGHGRMMSGEKAKDSRAPWLSFSVIWDDINSALY